MKNTTCGLLVLIALSSLASSEDIKIDLERAKELHQKQKGGSTLTAEEQKYLDAARHQYEAKNKSASFNGLDIPRLKALHAQVQKGKPLSSDDQKYYDEAKNRADSGKKLGVNLNTKLDDGFDWKRAKEIYHKNEKGEPLSPEEKKILDEAMKRRVQTGGKVGKISSTPSAPVVKKAPPDPNAPLTKKAPL